LDAIRKISHRLIADQNGATAIEYGLIAALIAIAAMGGMTALGGGSSGMWSRLSNHVENAAG
jgi:pilus assembly protein Flp/PilA